MSVKSVFIGDKKVAEKIVKLVRQAGMILDIEKVHNRYVMNITNDLPYDEAAIVEGAALEALGHVMSDFSGNSGHQDCSCGAEWKVFYSANGLERQPLNDLAQNHI